MSYQAAFSPDRRYRYEWRFVWDEHKPLVAFIGLNPSTADENHLDPTVRRCVTYAQDWGYGGVIMANLFAYKATQPRDLFAAAEPEGVENLAWLKKLPQQAALIVAAWGNDGRRLGQVQKIRALGLPLHYLKLNKSGEPAHPLYLPKNLTPKIWHYG